MKITYDRQADALYVKFKRNRVVRTSEITDYFLVDFDQEGEIVGIEILAASKHVPSRQVSQIEVLPLSAPSELSGYKRL